MNNTDIYLDILHETDQLLELWGLGMKVDKGVARKVIKTVDVKNPKTSIKSLKKLVPSGFNGKKSLSKIESHLTGKIKDFGPFNNTAKQVVKNSLPGISPQMVKISGIFLASISTIFTKKTEKNKPPKQALKNNIKEFVSKCRNFAEDTEEEDRAPQKTPSNTMDQAVGWVIIIMASTILGALLAGGATVVVGVWNVLAALHTGIVTTTSVSISTILGAGILPWIIGATFLIGFIFIVITVRGFLSKGRYGA